MCCCRKSQSHKLQLEPDQGHVSNADVEAFGLAVVVVVKMMMVGGGACGDTNVSKVTLLESLGECPSYFGLCSCSA